MYDVRGTEQAGIQSEWYWTDTVSTVGNEEQKTDIFSSNSDHTGYLLLQT